MPEPLVAQPNRHQDFMRLIGPENLQTFAGEASVERCWTSLPTLGTYFPRVHDRPGLHAEIDRALDGMRQWVGPAVHQN